MRFLGDMGISNRTIAWLRQNGHDAIHLRDEELQRLPDDKILSKARKEKRILLTMDLDFGYLLAVSKGKMPSVIIFRLGDERAANVNRRLADVLTKCADALQSGSVISVEETSLRVRRLPISKSSNP